MSVPHVAPVPSSDPHTALTTELTGLQIQIWLLEARQADVRLQLQQCRTRRNGLGREYRRALHLTQSPESHI